MSSIRPLATVTILIGVGVVLWMKINETEPVLPEGIGDWPIGAELEVGDASGALVAQNAMPPADGGGGAPRYAETDAPAFQSTASSGGGDTAPPWSPSPTAAAPTPRAADALPPMPGVPDLQETTPLGSNPGEPSPQGSVAATPPFPPLEGQNSVETGTADAPAVDVAAKVADGKTVTPTPQTSVFAAARVAVQSALDRGELSRALLVLSDWYDDTSLSPEEEQEVKTLLSQLAGTVIYSREPRLEAPYLVQAGETLDDIAAKYNVPTPLLAKINGLQRGALLEPGAPLKVMKGPFSATIDVSNRELVLRLDRRYAGRFDIDIEPDCSVEAGEWVVDQKPISPAGGYGEGEKVDRSLVLANPATGDGQVAVLRGARSAGDIATGPSQRIIRLQPSDINDVFDILSIGSRVTVRR